MELVRFGSLDKVLQSFGTALRTRSKLMMCEQICSAMCELAEEHVLHCHLAAHNVLVQSIEPIHVKVGGWRRGGGRGAAGGGRGLKHTGGRLRAVLGGGALKGASLLRR